MHSNWSHCLQEVFNSGKLAEKSYHQNSKNFAEKLEDVTLEDVSSTNNRRKPYDFRKSKETAGTKRI